MINGYKVKNRILAKTKYDKVFEILGHLPFMYLFFIALYKNILWKLILPKVLLVLRFYNPVNQMGSCRAWSTYLTTRLLGRLSPLSDKQYCAHSFTRNLQLPFLNHKYFIPVTFTFLPAQNVHKDVWQCFETDRQKFTFVSYSKNMVRYESVPSHAAELELPIQNFIFLFQTGKYLNI